MWWRSLTLLKMEDYAEVLVGEIARAFNVKQRKWTSIAVKLLVQPAGLILLNNPSSGLGSQSLQAIIHSQQDHGQAILATIHEPASPL